VKEEEEESSPIDLVLFLLSETTKSSSVFAVAAWKDAGSHERHAEPRYQGPNPSSVEYSKLRMPKTGRQWDIVG
jgi:hypothetical protein